jgi:hypothetical protein
MSIRLHGATVAGTRQESAGCCRTDAAKCRFPVRGTPGQAAFFAAKSSLFATCWTHFDKLARIAAMLSFPVLFVCNAAGFRVVSY